MGNQFENEAYIVVEAIKKLAAAPTRLDIMQSYLSKNFDVWLEQCACTPEDIAADFKAFADME